MPFRLSPQTHCEDVLLWTVQIGQAVLIERRTKGREIFLSIANFQERLHLLQVSVRVEFIDSKRLWRERGSEENWNRE